MSVINQVFNMFFGEPADGDVDVTDCVNDDDASHSSIVQTSANLFDDFSGTHVIDDAAPSSHTQLQPVSSLAPATAATEAATAPVKRKRGRPPKASRPVNKCSPTAVTPHSITRDRAFSFAQSSLAAVGTGDTSSLNGSLRIRNRRGLSDLSLGPQTPMSMCSDRSSLLSTNKRRSQRGRPLDWQREMVVLLPDTDPMAVLDIRDNEWEDFLLAMSEESNHVLDWSDNEDAHGGHGRSHSHSAHLSHGGSSSSVSLNTLSKAVTDESTAIIATATKTCEETAKAEVYVPAVTENIELDQLVQTARALGFRVYSERLLLPRVKSETTNQTTSTGADSNGIEYPSAMGWTAVSSEESFTHWDATDDDELFLSDLRSSLCKAYNVPIMSPESSYSNGMMVKQEMDLSAESLSAASVWISRLTANEVLETVIERLERELELIKRFSRPWKDMNKQHAIVSEMLRSSAQLCEDIHRLCLDEEEREYESGNENQDSPCGASDRESTVNRWVALIEREDRLTESALKSRAAQESIESMERERERELERERDREREAMREFQECDEKEDNFLTCNFDDVRTFSEAQLATLLPETTAVALLPAILAQQCYSLRGVSLSSMPVPSTSASVAVASDCSAADSIGTAIMRTVCARMWKYWIQRRAQVSQSLLRAYHLFPMSLWVKPSAVSVPLLRDSSISALTEGHVALSRRRRDLDRARLIVDRVRRREKLKRDLIRIASERVDREVIPHVHVDALIDREPELAAMLDDLQRQQAVLELKSGKLGGGEGCPLTLSLPSELSDDLHVQAPAHRKRGRPRRDPGVSEAQADTNISSAAATAKTLSPHSFSLNQNAARTPKQPNRSLQPCGLIDCLYSAALQTHALRAAMTISDDSHTHPTDRSRAQSSLADIQSVCQHLAAIQAASSSSSQQNNSLHWIGTPQSAAVGSHSWSSSTALSRSKSGKVVKRDDEQSSTSISSSTSNSSLNAMAATHIGQSLCGSDELSADKAHAAATCSAVVCVSHRDIATSSDETIVFDWGFDDCAADEVRDSGADRYLSTTSRGAASLSLASESGAVGLLSIFGEASTGDRYPFGRCGVTGCADMGQQRSGGYLSCDSNEAECGDSRTSEPDDESNSKNSGGVTLTSLRCIEDAVLSHCNGSTHSDSTHSDSTHSGSWSSGGGNDSNANSSSAFDEDSIEYARIDLYHEGLNRLFHPANASAVSVSCAHTPATSNGLADKDSTTDSFKDRLSLCETSIPAADLAVGLGQRQTRSRSRHPSG